MLSQEIGDAITNMPLGEQMDEGELEAELEGLEQEAMDERMLNTGPTPVGNRLEGLPAAGTAERKFALACSLPAVQLWRNPNADLKQSTSRMRKTKKRTRRPNWPNSRQKWPFEEGPWLCGSKYTPPLRSAPLPFPSRLRLVCLGYVGRVFPILRIHMCM